MASFNNKVSLKVAQQQKRNKFDLSCVHVSTSDFFTPRPVYVHEAMPNETLSVSMESFARLSPLVEPFLGQCRIVNRAFFVPMRTVMPDWNEFITNAPQYSGSSIYLGTKVATVTHDVLQNLFFENADYVKKYNSTDIDSNTLSICYTGDVAPDEVDFHFQNGLYVNYNDYVLTRKGKEFYNILCSLGYKINCNEETTSFSSLPLLAYARCFMDWINNPAYDNFKQIYSYFKKRSNLGADHVYNLLNCVYNVPYESSYFTSAWDKPVGPNISVSNVIIDDVTLPTIAHSEVASIDSNDVSPYVRSSSGSSSVNLSQYIIDSLKHLTDYIKRKQFVGQRALDRYEAEFGIKLDSAKLERSIYLGSHTVDVQVSDVMQTAPNSTGGTSNSNGVGNYAGKGIAFGNDGFKFSTDEFGYFIIMSYIEPKVNYMYGRPRYLQHINYLDFFTPEFDNLGPQAIRQDEVYGHDCTDASNHNFVPDRIFGYAPRFAEYKISTDNLTGDFLFQSKNVSLDGWVLSRNTDLTSKNAQIHSFDFCQASPYDFQNIFAVRNLSEQLLPTSFFDHFFLQYRFKVDALMPCKPLYDQFEMHSDGREISKDVNGNML